uniref:Reverse transcriptase Ty1/copia-type domain-containing protein n=1 Tax=Fagus sylvatica TaxID=28930 RepID=A0A2N9FKE7_FAGSY
MPRAKKLIHRQRDNLPPSDLPLPDSDHNTSTAVGKILESLTQPLEISLWLKVKFLNPFTSFLIGDNYSLWAQGMCSFLKGRKLWLYVTGQCHPPKQQKDETEDAFALRLEDWDGVNHRIIIWLRNTFTPSVSMKFGGYDTAKDVWDMLASRYAGSDGAREHHLMVTLYQLRQDPGERITAFHSRMRFLWDQLATSEPVIRSISDAKLVSTHRERLRLHQFLMGILDDFKSVRSQLLNCSPLPFVNQAVNDLVREETRLKSHRSSQPHTTVFATPASVDPTVTAPPKALTASGFVPSSDAASFDPVSLTTPTYSIADLQALFNSACCNHMTDNPHLTSAHTPPVLPTITTADGSAMTDSRTGQIVGTARKVGRLFELTSLHFPSSSVSAPVIAASASIELWHSRLGHVSLPRIQTLVSRGLLGSVSSSPFDCMPCQLGKQPALPFNNSESIASATFDLIHSDTQYSKAIKCTPSTDALHLSFKTQHHMNGCLAQLQTTVYSRFLVVSVLFFFNHMSALNFNLRSQLCCFLGYGLEEKGYRCYDPVAKRLRVSRHVVFWEHKMFYSLPSFSAADPTFDESPLSAPAANPVNTTAPEPRRSHRASSDPLWQQAMKEELDALLKTGTWDLVDLPAGKSAIGCKWVYKIKTRSDGTVDRYKARLVAKGFTQEYGIDYEETFDPVARLSSVPPSWFLPTSRLFSPKCVAYVGHYMVLSKLHELGLPSSAPPFLSMVFQLVHMIQLCSSDAQIMSLHPLMVTISLKPSTHLILSLELGITDSKIVDTPIEYNNRLNTHDGEPLPDATLYRQLVGSLVYLTAPCFMDFTSHLSRRSLSRLILMPTGQGTLPDRCSTTRYCFLLGDSLISWRSKKQSVVACSSTEAEYRALADTTAELLCAIQIAHNDVFHERTKHIEIDCHFVRHHLLQGTLQLRSVSSQDQLADIFTKPMPPGRFRDLISKLKLVSLHPT